MNVQADGGNLKAGALGFAGPDELRIEVGIVLVLFCRGFALPAAGRSGPSRA
jgi:hypothetical protein